MFFFESLLFLANLWNHPENTRTAFAPWISSWWQLKYFLFSSRKLGKMNPIWRAYFSNGLVQPPPRFCCFVQYQYNATKSAQPLVPGLPKFCRVDYLYTYIRCTYLGMSNSSQHFCHHQDDIAFLGSGHKSLPIGIHGTGIFTYMKGQFLW